jgi:hypothetical protein
MTTGTNDTPEAEKPGIDEIEADIARAREELAGTVDELTARLDVKARLRDRIQRTRDQAVHKVRVVRAQATDDEGKPTPATLASGGAVVATVVAVLGLVLWRRRRR